MPEGGISCTRPGVRGNPFYMAESFRRWLVLREINVTDLRPEWLPWNDGMKEKLAKKRDAILLDLPRLRGKKLGCWCGLDRNCHVDTIAELSNK